MVVLGGKKKKGIRRRDISYTLNCKRVVEDDILNLEDVKAYFFKKMIPDGKTSKVAQNLTISLTEDSVIFRSKTPFAKRYIKYLAKKYLTKKSLRDYIRVIASAPTDYELKYFDVQGNEQDIDEEKE